VELAGSFLAFVDPPEHWPAALPPLKPTRATSLSQSGRWVSVSARNAPVEALLLRFFLPLRSPISLHALRLRLSLCGSPAFPLGSSGCYCAGRRLIFRRPAPPLRRALKSLNSAVQFVTFCSQQRDDVFGRHELLRIARRGIDGKKFVLSCSRLRWRPSHRLQQTIRICYQETRVPQWPTIPLCESMY
jgi:hypothetical protein